LVGGPLGTGYTTPGFGSLLYQYIGRNQAAVSTSSIDNEILRVLQLYQGQQVISLKNAQNAAMLSNWNKSEIIQNIVSVKSSLQGTSIIASIQLTTLDNSTINLNLSVDNNGVTVQNG